MCRRAIADANYVIVNSQSTQDERIQTLRGPKGEDRVVYPGELAVQGPGAEAGSGVHIAQYGVPLGCIWHLQGQWSRKNLEAAGRSSWKYEEYNRLDCSLVVAGASGWKDSPLFREPSRRTYNRTFDSWVIFRKRICHFLAGAQVFLFPSIYEGSGCPIEAMACGSPVIASDPLHAGSTRDATIIEPITEPEHFASAISRVVDDDQLRRVLREKGVAAIESFVYETSVKRPPWKSSSLRTDSRAARSKSRRCRIAVRT